MTRGRITICLLAVGLMAIQLAGSVRAQGSPQADFQFQNSLASGSGAELENFGACPGVFSTEEVDGTARRVFAFAKGSGLRLSPTSVVVSDDEYSIVILMRFEETSGYRKIIDFSNGTSDAGLYALNQGLSFYPVTSAATGWTPNTWVQVAITRSSDGTVTGYFNGTQAWTFADTSNRGVVAEDTLQFFIDNQSGSAANAEHSAGAVARLRLYNDALSSSEISGLDRLPSASPASGSASTPVCGSASDDTIEGTEEDDTIYAGEGNDTINGGGGDDVIVGAGGDDVITGGEGDDILIGDDESDSSEGTPGYPLLGSFLQEEEPEPVPPGNDVLDGGTGNDLVDGSAGNDVVKGGGGLDQVEGGAGKDKVTGQAGGDDLSGSAGPDNLNGGPGVDDMNGGAGKDTCVLDTKKEKSRTESCEKKKFNFKFNFLPLRYLRR